MPSTLPLLKTLANDYPDLTLTAGEQFEWHPNETVIVYNQNDPSFEARLLHEIGHYLLSHTSYDRDIDLVAMERDAWQAARITLGPTYSITISSDEIDADMDTYRDWLHSRSTCPYCESTGIQTSKKAYTCVTCRKTWKVNEARTCALRRYKSS